MPSTPRLGHLVTRARGAFLAGALGLPAPVQRVLAGRPVVLDGQTLAVDVQLLLRLKRLVREPGPDELPLDQGRRLLVEQMRMTGRDQVVGGVREVAVGDLGGRLYVPRGASAPSPLLVFFHGGGWVFGDLDSHEATCRFLCERSGVRVLSVDYRLAPEAPFPAATDDAVAAYRWVVANAASLGADPQRLAVGGDSAGGNLAAVVAIAAAREGLPLAFQLLLYPGTDHASTSESRRMFSSGFYLTQGFMDTASAHYLPDEAARRDPAASPILAEIPAGLAPAYVATAGFDPLRDEGEAYAHRLADAGVEVELQRFPDQIHGFASIVGVGRTAKAAAAVVAVKLGAALAGDPGARAT